MNEEELLRIRQTCESLKTVKEPGKDTFFFDIFELIREAPKLLEEVDLLKAEIAELRQYDVRQWSNDNDRHAWPEDEDYECEF